MSDQPYDPKKDPANRLEPQEESARALNVTGIVGWSWFGLIAGSFLAGVLGVYVWAALGDASADSQVAPFFWTALAIFLLGLPLQLAIRLGVRILEQVVSTRSQAADTQQTAAKTPEGAA